MPEGDAADLFASLAEYGYSLLQPQRTGDPNELLKRISASNDSRVLEGFPVVLANALRHHSAAVRLDAAAESLPPGEERQRFRGLVEVSFALLDWYGLARGEVRPKWLKEDVQQRLQRCFADGDALKPGESLKLDPERLRNTFVSYVLRGEADRNRRDVEEERFNEELRLAYSLSLLLSPKQKQLVYKKLRGEAMSKTEKEYFSRVVKKKLKAMADPDLHRLAQKALQ